MIPLSFPPFAKHASAVEDVIDQARDLLETAHADYGFPSGYLQAWFSQVGRALMVEARWHGQDNNLLLFEPRRFSFDRPPNNVLIRFTPPLNHEEVAQKFEEQMRTFVTDPGRFPVRVVERPGGPGVHVLTRDGIFWAWSEGPPTVDRLHQNLSHVLGRLTDPNETGMKRPVASLVIAFFEHLFNEQTGTIPRLLKEKRYEEIFRIGHALDQLLTFHRGGGPVKPPSHEQLGELEQFRPQDEPPLSIPEGNK